MQAVRCRQGSWDCWRRICVRPASAIPPRDKAKNGVQLAGPTLSSQETLGSYLPYALLPSLQIPPRLDTVHWSKRSSKCARITLTQTAFRICSSSPRACGHHIRSLRRCWTPTATEPRAGKCIVLHMACPHATTAAVCQSLLEGREHVARSAKAWHLSGTKNSAGSVVCPCGRAASANTAGRNASDVVASPVTTKKIISDTRSLPS